MGTQTTASGSGLTLLCDPGSSTVTRSQADAWFRQRQLAQVATVTVLQRKAG